MAYMLVVEWNGAHPPTSWYNKLHSMGLWVRPRRNAENRESTLQARKRSSSNGLVLQEGVIIVNNEADLEELSRAARHLGAKTVLAGIASIEQSADRDDLAAVASFESKEIQVFRKARTHLLTCLEELATHEIGTRVSACPKCRTSNIILRPDAIPYRVNPYPMKAISLFDFFVAARFWKGPNADPSYEFNQFDDTLPGPDKTDFNIASIASLKGDNALASLRTSTLYALVVEYYYKCLEPNRDEIALRLLDRGYVYLRTTQRLSGQVLNARNVARLMAFTEYTQAGGTRPYPLAHDGDEVDPLDLWSKERDIVLKM